MRGVALCLSALTLIALGCGDEGPGGPAVPPAPTIATEPVDATALEGDWVTFVVEASGSGLAYRWEHSTDGGATWYPLAWGAWSSYTIQGASLDDDGLSLRCVVSNPGGEVTSDVAALTVQPLGTGMAAPVITSQPGDLVAAAGSWATFTVAASGEDLAYEWQRSSDGGATWFPAAWGEWESYTLEGVALGDDGLRVRCVVSNPGGEATSDVARLDVVRVIHVDASVETGSDGTSWETAFKSLAEALGAATAGHEIWVAGGTYKPTETTGQSETFAMKPGVDIYGGFSGDETVREERDWSANITILSGDIGVEGLDTDNSYNVVTGCDDARLDGFTITAGYAELRDGAGMYSSFASPTVANCTFAGNSAMGYGGGAYCQLGSPVFSNCAFDSNDTDSSGGGLSCSNCDVTVTGCIFVGNTAHASAVACWLYNGTAVLTGCTFTGNVSDWAAGGLRAYLGTCTLEGCTFARNDALTDHGGGVFFSSDLTAWVEACSFDGNSAVNGGGLAHGASTDVFLVNCAFCGNVASGAGGALDTGAGDADAVNCTFTQNHADTGGAVHADSGSASLVNCILWDDEAATSGDEIQVSTAIFSAAFSCIEGGHAGKGNIGEEPSSHDPLFAGTPGPGGDAIWGTVDDDYGDLRISAGSPCIDTGYNDPFQAGGSAESVTTDLAGGDRIVDGDGLDTDSSGDGDTAEVDMGAHERP